MTQEEDWLTLHVDGSSNPKGVGVDIILEGPNQIVIEKLLNCAFRTSNNQVEYKAILASLVLAIEVRAHRIICKTDSKLMVDHFNNEYQIKDPMLLQHYHLNRDIISTSFNEVWIQHVPKGDNVRADTVSKLASTKNKGKCKSLLQQMLMAPSASNNCMNIEQKW